MFRSYVNASILTKTSNRQILTIKKKKNILLALQADSIKLSTLVNSTSAEALFYYTLLKLIHLGGPIQKNQY